MRIEISDFVMRAFVPIQREDSSHAVFFSFGNVSTFRKDGFLRSSMRHRRKEGNHETCRAAPARYMDVAGFLFAQIFYNCNTEWGQHLLSFFILATSLLSERMVSFDPLCGIAARKETMKLAGLRLRVIWTLPFFSYLNLGKIERKN